MNQNFFPFTIFLLIFLGGCSTRLEIKNEPTDPVVVYLLDHGIHSSLVLPRNKGDEYVEYAFGEWKWFAQNKDAWYRVPAVLFWPTEGTLGRIEYKGAGAKDSFRKGRGEIIIHSLNASKKRVRDLLEILDKKYENKQASEIFNQHYGMKFVPDNRSFYLWRTCNHLVAQWLEILDYGISGSVILSSWDID